MGEIFIILILIFLNGLFAMAEIAVISARKSSLQSDANKGSKAAWKALRLAENPDRFLSSVQVEWGCFRFEVVDMDGPRIDKVIVKKILE